MQNYGGQPAKSADPNAILNECREVDRAIDDLNSQLKQLQNVFGQVLARPDMPSGEINNISSQIMTSYRGLVGRVKNIKSKHRYTVLKIKEVRLRTEDELNTGVVE